MHAIVVTMQFSSVISTRWRDGGIVEMGVRSDEGHKRLDHARCVLYSLLL